MATNKNTQNQGRPNEPIWLTQTELGVALNVSVRQVRALTKKGIIPCIRVGTRLPRYALEEVVERLRDVEWDQEAIQKSGSGKSAR